jgi:hypothetical protein
MGCLRLGLARNRAATFPIRTTTSPWEQSAISWTIASGWERVTACVKHRAKIVIRARTPNPT